MKRRFLRYAPLFFLTAMLLAGNSFAAFSLDERDRESGDPYTLGDIAAARFAVYGLLDDECRTPNEKTSAPLSRMDAVEILWKAFRNADDLTGEIPFADVDDKHFDAVSWAYANGIAGGCSPVSFGAYPVTEQAFLTMLLKSLGYRNRFAYADAFEFAETVGLFRPVGISPAFTLGDAMLYLQDALGVTAPDGYFGREKMNIPPSLEDADRTQTTFPLTVILRPVSVEDAQAQIELATRYLTEEVWILPDNWSAEGLFDLYRCYVEDAKREDTWYVARILDEIPVQPFADVADREMSAEEKALFMEVMGALEEQWADGSLSKEDYDYSSVIARIENGFSEMKSLTLSVAYNEAWELACDADDAFVYYADETVSRLADGFYKLHVAGAKTDKDAVYKAKNAIVRNASYASALGFANGEAKYSDAAHSVLGLFQNGRIVCDGYAKAFQYLMHRAGVPCVAVFGSTESEEAASEEQFNHAWNKVFLNGKWLNMDVCWADTGWPTTFDLKTDAQFARHNHWPVTHTALK